MAADVGLIRAQSAMASLDLQGFANSGLRGKADPAPSRPRRHRSTRRRQDAPDLPKRKISNADRVRPLQVDAA